MNRKTLAMIVALAAATAAASGCFGLFSGAKAAPDAGAVEGDCKCADKSACKGQASMLMTRSQCYRIGGAFKPR